jgi:GrpB-like predicted nucleotidyltransferase (UPF0157 family)
MSSRFATTSEPTREAAREYGALKRRLAKQFERDREAYTAAKAEFVAATVGRALREAAD